MEQIIDIHIEKLAEGTYLATSDDVQGLVAQGRTIAETLEIARDVARKLIDIHRENGTQSTLRPISDSFDYPLVLGV